MDIFKRVGTKAVQYQIDIILNKLYMNVNVPGCEISIILKRGDHKAETKIPAPLKDKLAKFNKQQITVPTKLYWDDKKREFLAKSAELQINIIHQKKVRTAGKIEFDVAAYANKSIKTMMEQRQLQKCPDTSAKLLYEIRVHEFGDYSYYQKKEEEEEEERVINRTKTGTSNNRARDVSPMIDTSGMNSARGQIQDIDNFPSRSKSPMTKVDQQNKQVSFSRNNQEYPQNNGTMNSTRGNHQQDESSLRSNLFSQQSTAQASKQINTNGSSQIYNSNTNGNSTLQNAISNISKQQELTNSNQMRDLFKQQKEENMSLRQKIQEQIIENDSLKQQVDSLKNENQRLKARISTLEGFNGQSVGKNGFQQEAQSYEDQIKKLYEEIKTLKQQNMKDTNEEMQKQLKALEDEQEIIKDELNLKFEREKSVYEKKIKDLQLTVEELNQRLQENQSEISKKQKDLEYFKNLVNKSQREDTENENMLSLQRQLQELSQKNAQQEKEYRQKIKDLQEENSKIKKDRELEVIELRRSKTESDFELGKLSRENDQLKKDLKEMQTKYNQAKSALQQQLNKEGTEVSSSKGKELQNKIDELNNNLKKVSVERGNIEMERDNLKSYIKQKDEEMNKLKYQVTSTENRLKNTKESLCELLNVILMAGDRDLIDEAEPYLNEPEEPEYVPQNITSSMNQYTAVTTSPNTLYTPTPFNFNQFTNNLITSESKTNEIYKSNQFSDKSFL
ncbi:EEIG1/EHBP1 protein amine-terminal domain protein (macronuclear) [Tetrahymena thermophila SB210]|uniref:EEIG1/EHBP1 protein amine-terminal domain protein n=1 Tax=Tetrahymena thermophila (strain SB210) TaxID=312017 RepID=Q22U09_TETTS|nr:EEIG1/EHBP1 protein amine-terminal domain protein [Tetrahymena thermophila SB210]EAR88878.2 EEIG1/EHBP1 protein amine-terminal domain protein [Tetrahymena thermophila SB210]|eukprot:XP_001009123.2 EEIG1/EHBP1 protein amine-terminal domain protein [Tetrahymena thermophila SB210]